MENLKAGVDVILKNGGTGTVIQSEGGFEVYGQQFDGGLLVERHFSTDGEGYSFIENIKEVLPGPIEE